MSEMAANILVVEDEEHIAEGIAEVLDLEGYRVRVVGDGPSGLDALKSGAFDLVLLDVMLPEMNGYEVCQAARAAGVQTPVLFLTARGAVDDRIRGLEAGGDDYLPKPFHLKELLLRISVILRRSPRATPSPKRTVEFGGNRLDIDTGEATSWDGAPHRLTARESRILGALLSATGEILTREDLLEAGWGHEVYPSTRAVEGIINRLRRRFERDPENPDHLHTVRGVGYRFTPQGEPAHE